MRQGQQNRRGRGRNNGNPRKGQNPLTRSFESNGPDVKIRGTPSHIAEKYMALARDAHASGDPVLSENYLQHAEHYNRIIMAFREQQMGQQGEMANGGQNPGMGRPRPDAMGLGDEFSYEEGDEFAADVGGGQQPMTRQQEQPQRSFDRPRFDDRGQHHRSGQDPYRQQHQPRDRDRSGGGERGFQHERGPRPERQQHTQDAGGDSDQHRRRDRGGVPSHEQPEFLRRPVRRPRRDLENAEDEAPVTTSGPDDRNQE